MGCVRIWHFSYPKDNVLEVERENQIYGNCPLQARSVACPARGSSQNLGGMLPGNIRRTSTPRETTPEAWRAGIPRRGMLFPAHAFGVILHTCSPCERAPKAWDPNRVVFGGPRWPGRKMDVKADHALTRLPLQGDDRRL